MTRQELKEQVGKFGILQTRKDKDGYEKTLPGRIKDSDARGSIWFVDNDGYGYVFRPENILSFDSKEFESLPSEYSGKEIYWEGGRAYYKGSNKECHIKK